MRVMVIVLAALLAGSVAAQQQVYVDMSTQGNENINYAYADVLRADPTYELIQVRDGTDECVDPIAGNPSRHDIDADEADMERALVRTGPGQMQTVGVATQVRRECRALGTTREERRISGYDVEYRYKGQLYRSHMGYDPGNKLRIRITIAPAD